MSSPSVRRSSGQTVAVVLALLAIATAGAMVYMWVFERGAFHYRSRRRSEPLPASDFGLYRLKLQNVSLIQSREGAVGSVGLPGEEGPETRKFVQDDPPPVPFIPARASGPKPALWSGGSAGYPGGTESQESGAVWKQAITEAGIPVVPTGSADPSAGTLYLLVRVADQQKDRIVFCVNWKVLKQVQFEIEGLRVPVRTQAQVDSWSTAWYMVKRDDAERAIEYATRLCVSNFVREYKRQNQNPVP